MEADGALSALGQSCMGDDRTDQRLASKVIVVTGGSSGIGESSAILFAREGAKVVVADVDEGRGNEVVRGIRAFQGEAKFVRCDVSKPLDAESLIQITIGRFDRIDGLLNNAGINPMGTVVSTSTDLWDTVLGTNLKGMFLVSKFAVPAMSRNSTGGAIVNVSSVDAILALRNEAAYVASKGGVISLTKAMAIDHARVGIRVNCICPGAILTPLVMNSLEIQGLNKEEMLAKMARMHPIGRIGKPEDIAQTALFLLSDESSFITGSVLNVDGGYTATKE